MPSRQKSSIKLRISDYFTNNHLSGKVLIAVSGGQDSICLLHLLAGLQSKLKLNLHIAHLNHQLRGRESDADAQYVFDLCHKLGLPVTIGQADVKGYQTQHKFSLEEAAREVRYQFLAETAKSIKAKMVAVAHTRDDNVETILLHILRGSGTRGLVGLQAVGQRVIAGNKLTIIRPLLDITREETGKYCRVHKLHPRLDTTNFSLEPLRNRVRLELLPTLKTYNEGIGDALLRTSQIAADDLVLIETLTRISWRRIVNQKDGEIYFNREKLLELPVGLQRNLLRMAVEKQTGTLKDIEARHIEEMLGLLQKPAGKNLDLPYGLCLSSDYRHFILRQVNQNNAGAAVLCGEHVIKLPGSTKIPGWQIQADFINPAQIRPGNEYTAHLDADLIGEILTVRQRCPGDRFQPLGMQTLKKVSDFMLDARVPVRERVRVPVVVSEKQVLWVVGWRIDDRVKVAPRTGRVLKLVFTKK